MSKKTFALSAIAAAVALYAVAFAILGMFYEPKCQTMDKHWWGSIYRCQIEIPTQRGAP